MEALYNLSKQNTYQKNKLKYKFHQKKKRIAIQVTQQILTDEFIF